MVVTMVAIVVTMVMVVAMVMVVIPVQRHFVTTKILYCIVFEYLYSAPQILNSRGQQRRIWFD